MNMFIKPIARGAGAALFAVAAMAVLLPLSLGAAGELLIFFTWPLVALTAYVLTIVFSPDGKK